LFPPSEWHNLYLYPKTHPRHRQAQVNINDPDFDTFPKLRQAKGIEVVLDAGTVMYLPPLWFHQVESLTDAISINTWYHSQDVVSDDFISRFQTL
jgi:ribosomal protein L16 Arg81 hydroxylase